MAAHVLTQDDLRWLVCPVCHQQLRLEAAPPSIRCLGCLRLFPIVDQLPALFNVKADVLLD